MDHQMINFIKGFQGKSDQNQCFSIKMLINTREMLKKT